MCFKKFHPKVRIITEKAPTRAFSWLKAATTAFTFKTQLRHYAKRPLITQCLNVKLGPRRNYHKGRAAIRHYVKAVVASFNQEKALVGAFSVIIRTFGWNFLKHVLLLSAGRSHLMCIRRSGAWREWTTRVHKSLHGPQGKRGQMWRVLTAVDFTDESLIGSWS